MKKIIWALIGIFTAVIFLFQGISVAESQKHVLYISSYHPGFPTFFQQVSGLKSAFEGKNILMDIEFMDTKRFPSSETIELFRKQLSYKLQNSERYDVLVVADDNALTFALDNQSTLFHQLPVVFLGINNIEKALQQNQNPYVTGVVEKVSMKETINLMIQLRPRAKKIVALVDGTPSGQSDLKHFYTLSDKFPSVELTELSLKDASWPEFLGSIANLTQDSNVLLLSAYTDNRGTTYRFPEGLKMIKAAIKLPLFHLWGHGMEDGILGGKIISHAEQGRVAGGIVMNILNHVPVNNIVVREDSPNRYVFDYDELKKWHIPKSSLPVDHIILNEPISFYQKNKAWVLSVTLTILVLAMALLSAILNIYKRKEVEKSLRSSEERFRTITESSADAVFITNQEGCCVYANQRASRLLGYSVDEIKDMCIWQLVDANKEKESLVAFRKLLQKGELVSEVRLKKKSGNSIPVDLNAVVLPNQLIYGSVRDISRRKDAEVEHKRLQEQLNQVQKMESVGRLAGGVAHDFNNMLAVILGHTELLMEDLPFDSPFLRNMEEIQKSAQRSAELTRQLLAFARKQNASPKVIDFNHTIENMLKMLGRLIGEGINLVWNPGQPLHSVLIDPVQVDQVLANLAVNARDAIGTDIGKVTIETKNVEFSTSYCDSHPDFQVGQYVMLSFSDDGCGMDSTVKKNIFEPFFTTKRLDQGTGLGMATVYGIVKQNKGFIHIHSEVGIGTTFKIYFPMHSKTKNETVESEISLTKPEGGNELILLVEDEPAILDMSKHMLERLGYSILAANTPDQAIHFAGIYNGNIKLLMTDVVMPEMNGRDLAKELKNFSPHIKILFMSGYTANVIANQGRLNKGENFLQKPFTIDQLAKQVRNALNS